MLFDICFSGFQIAEHVILGIHVDDLIPFAVSGYDDYSLSCFEVGREAAAHDVRKAESLCVHGDYVFNVA